ncbi:MAG: lysylphosphatidylglycerol synthase transmembrane domain-containing protein [Clostridia bacterium]|nr:lysylphosphatidylglycerol synthase transmembrane domain-containing protein [Clostridia bacterium]
MSKKTKKLLNFALIFGTLAIVLFIGFQGQDFESAMRALQDISIWAVIMCLIAYFGYVFFDALGLFYFIRRNGYKTSLRYSLFVSIAGMYYSNVTPGATGGQPMQVFYMKKAGIPIGIGTSAITVRLFCFQFMLEVISTVLWATHAEFIAQQVGSNMWILVCGYIYNTIVVLLISMMALSRRLVSAVVNLFIKVGAKLRICKDPDASRTRWAEVVELFHSSIKMLRHRPVDLLIQLGIAAAQLLSQMLVIYILYRDFDLTGASYLQITTLAVLLYVSAAYTPLPGASGAQEGVFALFFSGLFPDSIRFVALLLWRFFTYYVGLIIGAIVTVYRGISPHKFKDVPAEDGAA